MIQILEEITETLETREVENINDFIENHPNINKIQFRDYLEMPEDKRANKFKLYTLPNGTLLINGPDITENDKFKYHYLLSFAIRDNNIDEIFRLPLVFDKVYKGVIWKEIFRKISSLR